MIIIIQKLFLHHPFGRTFFTLRTYTRVHVGTLQFVLTYCKENAVTLSFVVMYAAAGTEEAAEKPGRFEASLSKTNNDLLADITHWAGK